MIIHLAYEFGLAPSMVSQESDRMIATMFRYLRWRQVIESRQQRGRQ